MYTIKKDNNLYGIYNSKTQRYFVKPFTKSKRRIKIIINTLNKNNIKNFVQVT